MPTDTKIDQIVINKLTTEKYEELLSLDQVVNTELYFITDGFEVTESMHNSKANQSDLTAIDVRVQQLEQNAGSLTNTNITGTKQTIAPSNNKKLTLNAVSEVAANGWEVSDTKTDYELDLSSFATGAELTALSNSFSAGTGLTLNNLTFSHSNSVNPGTAQGGSGALANGGTFTVPKITYDAQGHITGTDTTTYTLPTASDTATNATNIYSTASTSKAYVLGTTTTGSSNKATVYNASVYTSGSVLYGAAWNDYAEYRISDCQEAGRVICENGDDTLSMSIKRLQPGANIVSDTFGFAIGETEEAKTPIAVSGRVLAFPYEDRCEFAAGDAVCAGPNGTVSKMTREEIREYPERIIGTVSAIPNYETWGEGNVPVNGRIWIKVK